MPIKYDISADGHFIHAIADGVITPKEFVEFEVAHGSDKRLKPPVDELLEIKSGAFNNINKDDVSEVLQQRKTLSDLPTPHRCAIVIANNDIQGWNIAKYYEQMVTLHYPASVIVFGDMQIAKIWLGIA